MKEGIHKPDCSAVTDRELKKLLTSRWPIVNGIANIPYTFKQQFRWFEIQSLIDYLFMGLVAVDNKPGVVKHAVRRILNQWETASKGAIKFFEQDGIAKAIHFKYTNNYIGTNTIATTVTTPGYFGEISSAHIYLSPNIAGQLTSNSTTILQKALHTLRHESGHAIGTDHLHLDPDIADKLRHTREGIFCSVMTYPKFILTEISGCASYCSSFYSQQTMGSLDERTMALMYGNDRQALDGIEALKFNAYCMLGASMLSMGSYSLIGMTYNQIAPKKWVKPLSDLSFMSAAILMGVPAIPIGVFAFVSTLQNIFNQPTIKDFSNIIFFNLALALMAEGEFSPEVTTSRLLGAVIFLLPVCLINLCTRPDLDEKFEDAEEVQDFDPEIEKNNRITYSDTHQFFRRTSKSLPAKPVRLENITVTEATSLNSDVYRP